MGDLIGINNELTKLFNLDLETGRSIEKKDINKKNKVVLISAKLAEKLFGKDENNNFINSYLSIDGNNYKIIGIFKSKGTRGLGSDLDANVFIPYTTLSNVLGEKTIIIFF